MDAEWDARKAAINRRKHGIDFADAIGVVTDPLAVTLIDDEAGEDRFVTIGRDTLGRIMVVVYTWAGENVRLISARRATAGERATYGEER
jgi:uncharacterized protein